MKSIERFKLSATSFACASRKVFKAIHTLKVCESSKSFGCMDSPYVIKNIMIGRLAPKSNQASPLK